MKNTMNTQKNAANTTTADDYRNAIAKITAEISDINKLKKIYEYAQHKKLHK